MNFDPVESSMIEAVGYDPAQQRLGIRFKRGKTLTYKDVPPDVAEALQSAQSVGKQFHATIAGNYELAD